MGFSTGRDEGLDYGWDCSGDTNVDYSGGRRGLDRDQGLGLNHFDHDSTCSGPVNWQISVPNGAYNVDVNFGEDSAAAGWGKCAVDHVGEDANNYLEVEKEVACFWRPGCDFQDTVVVEDGKRK